MVVRSVLLFLFPAGLSLKIKEDYFGEEKRLKDLLLTYIKYVLFINLFVFAVIYFYYKGELLSLSDSLESISFVFKYMLLSIIVSIIVPIGDEYLKKNVHIKLNLKTREKKNEKKNK
ncbi:MAG: hypothetical protein IJ463_06140 [Bacilli bacterium]|nr:hypothetical protein [Bacilli bacterium]